MANFNKKCTYCGTQIIMSDEIGKKWAPYNADGSPHDCRNNGNGKEQAQKPITKQEKEQITLQAVQMKLAELGIIVNVERLMAS